MNKHHITWTEDRKQSVAVLLREGLSAGQISKRLEISRNAIIGIIHRDPLLSKIGLAGTVGGARKPRAESKPYKKGRLRTGARPVKVRKSKPARLDGVDQTVEIITAPRSVPTKIETLGLPLAALNRDQCRFAINNATKGEQHLFCGQTVDEGSSFCRHHHLIVFVPAPRLKGL